MRIDSDIDIENDPFHINSVSFSPANFHVSLEKSMQSSLSISHVNVRSLNRNFYALKHLFDEENVKLAEQELKYIKENNIAKHNSLDRLSNL